MPVQWTRYLRSMSSGECLLHCYITLLQDVGVAMGSDGMLGVGQVGSL